MKKRSNRKNKTFRAYHQLLSKDKDFDWQFMVELEKLKLNRMFRYFKSSGISADKDQMCSEISLAIKLLEIVCEDDKDESDSWKIRYININNSNRFVRYEKENLTDPDGFYLRDDLRIEKAWALYNNLRKEKMRTWWD